MAAAGRSAGAVTAGQGTAHAGGPPSAPRRGFTEIPNYIADDPTLDALSVCVYLVIKRRDFRGEGWVWTFAELTEAVGCCAETLRRRLTILEERGLIRREGMSRQPKRYFALALSGVASLPEREPEAPFLAPPIATRQRSHRYETAITSLPRSDASLSKTIKDDHRVELPLGARERPIATAPPDGPSVPQSAIETIATALVAARGSTLDVEAKRGTLGEIKRQVLSQLVLAFAGDRRQVTPAKVVRCIAYLRSKPHIAANPTLITAKTVGDELGPWLDAGEPDRYRAPERPAKGRRPQQAAGPPSTRGPAFVVDKPVLCACCRLEGYQHKEEECGLSGVITRDNFRPQGDPGTVYTRERPYRGQ